jgi:hypothetical protein
MARPTPVPRSTTSTPAPAPARRLSDLRPTSVLAWEEPPPPSPRGGKRPGWYAGILAELKANPQRWAKVLIVPTPKAASSKLAGYRAAMRTKRAPRGFEFVARRLSDGRGVVYGRYVGRDGD